MPPRKKAMDDAAELLELGELPGGANDVQGERDELEDGDGENGENGEERVYAANEIARIQDLAKEGELWRRRCLAAEALAKSFQDQGKRADSSRRTRSGSGSKGRRRSRPPTRRSSSKSSEDEPRKRRDKFPEERSRSRSRRRRGSLRSSVDEREFRDREKEERRRKRSRPGHERLDKEVERLTRKIVKDEIRSRDGQTWNRTGNLKQFEFNSDVLTVQEDLGVALEKFFQGVGMEIPSSVNGILAQGKQKLNERNLDLRRADDAGWDAVEQFHRDPLCSTEDQEKRWKKAKKEAQEKREKDKDKKTSVRGGGRGGASRDAGRGGFYGAKLFGPRQSYFPPAPFLMGRGGGGFYPRGGQGGWQDSWRRAEMYPPAGGSGRGFGQFNGICRRCHKYGHKADSCHVDTEKK